MPSSVSAERVVDCPFSLAVDEAHHIFPMLETSSKGGVRIPLRALGLPFAGAVQQPVAVVFRRERDATEPGRLHDEIAFDWNARSRWLPNLSGVLRFRIEALRTRVILSGEYVPPFGPLGVAFDHVVGRRLAIVTVNDVLDRLASELETRWAAERGPTT